MPDRIQVSTTNNTTLQMTVRSNGALVPDDTEVKLEIGLINYATIALTVAGVVDFVVPALASQQNYNLIDATVRVASSFPVVLTLEAQEYGAEWVGGIDVDDDGIKYYTGTAASIPGPEGPQGPPGEGVPAEGTTGQVLAKASGDDYDTEWVNPGGGAQNLGDLGDVEVAGAVDGQVLGYDGTDWVPVDQASDIQDRTYSRNLDLIAERITRGDASILIVGDSINNPTQGGYMRGGYINQWAVDSWKGISPAFGTGNGIDNMFTAVGSNGANIDGVATQNGPSPNDIAVLGSYASGINVASGGNVGGGWFGQKTTDTVGGNTTDNDPAFEIARVTPVSNSKNRFIGTQDSLSVWGDPTFEIKSLWFATQPTTVQGQYRGGTFADTINIDHALTAGYNILSGPVGNSANAGNNQFSSWTSKGAANDEAQLIAVLGTCQRPGLTMGYVGSGGWAAGNHRYENNSAPPVPASGGLPCWYFNSAVTAYMDLLDTNIVMIHIGQNDNLASYNADIQGVVDRFKAMRPTADILIVSQYPTADDTTKNDGQAATARALAGSAGYENVAFLDLNQMVQDNLGDWSTWEATYLDDGIHPNATGSDTFAEYEWQEIVAARDAAPGATAVQSVNGDTGPDVFLTGDDIETSGSDTTSIADSLTGLGGAVVVNAGAISSLDADKPDSVSEGGGSDAIENIVSMTQSEYDDAAFTPVATTFYIITGP